MLIGSEKAKDAILRDLSRLQVEKDKRGRPSNHVPIQNLQPDSFVIPCWVFPLVFPWHAPSPFISFLVLFFLCYVSAPLKGCTVVKLKFPRSGLVIHRSKKGANIISIQAILMLRIFYTDTPFIPPCLRIGHSLQIMQAMLLLFSYYKQYRSGCSFLIVLVGDWLYRILSFRQSPL
jgi:hypothetical protein